MYPYSLWFTTYEAYEGGMNLMENNSNSKTVVVGIMCLQMFDGIVQVLEDVRYILD